MPQLISLSSKLFLYVGPYISLLRLEQLEYFKKDRLDDRDTLDVRDKYVFSAWLGDTDRLHVREVLDVRDKHDFSVG